MDSYINKTEKCPAGWLESRPAGRFSIFQKKKPPHRQSDEGALDSKMQLFFEPVRDVRKHLGFVRLHQQLVAGAGVEF